MNIFIWINHEFSVNYLLNKILIKPETTFKYFTVESLWKLMIFQIQSIPECFEDFNQLKFKRKRIY